jgi:hypothetical protein
MGAVNIMLMENTLQIQNLSQLKCTYDLKGSTAGRKTTGLIKPTTVQKDLNFLEQRKIKINENGLVLRRIISRDSIFLREMGLLDYSLLLAVEKLPNAKRQFGSEKEKLRAPYQIMKVQGVS